MMLERNKVALFPFFKLPKQFLIVTQVSVFGRCRVSKKGLILMHRIRELYTRSPVPVLTIQQLAGSMPIPRPLGLLFLPLHE